MNVRLRGKWTFPGRSPGCARSGCFPGRDDVRGKLGINRDVCAEENSSVRARPEVCARMMGVPRTEMWCAENLTDIKPGSVVESPVCVWSVTGSLLFGSPLGRV